MGQQASADAVAPVSQGLLIDESGNICQPPSNPRPPLGGIQLRDTRSARFGSLSDRPSDAEGTQQGRSPPLSGLQAVFPRFSLRSIVGALAAAQVIVYLASCWVVTPRGFIAPNGSVLTKLGSNDHIMDQCAILVGGKFILELRRFLTPIFLHVSIFHIVGNISVQVGLGPRIFATYGSGLYVCIFLASGACGNVFSDAVWASGVGASTSCYGLVGAFLAQIWLVWNSLEAAWREWARNILGLIIIIAVVSFFIPASPVHIINSGHIGGCFGGFLLAVVFTREAPLPVIPGHVPALPSNMGLRQQICGAVFAIFILACLCKIFVLDPPPISQVPGINGTMVEVNGAASCEQHWASIYT